MLSPSAKTGLRSVMVMGASGTGASSPSIAARGRHLDDQPSVSPSHRCQPRAQPESFFTIPHFDGCLGVLVQLKTVTERRLREALLDGWLACAPPHLARAYIEQRTARGR
jgi:hypothetical protein